MNEDKDKKTTIAIDLETSKLVDDYCRKRGMLKRDFVAKATRAIISLGVVIDSDTPYVDCDNADEPKKEKEDTLQRQTTIDQTLQVFNAQFSGLSQNLAAAVQALLVLPSQIKTSEQTASLEAMLDAANSRIEELQRNLYNEQLEHKATQAKALSDKAQLDAAYIRIKELQLELSNEQYDHKSTMLKIHSNKEEIKKLAVTIEKLKGLLTTAIDELNRSDSYFKKSNKEVIARLKDSLVHIDDADARQKENQTIMFVNQTDLVSK